MTGYESDVDYDAVADDRAADLQDQIDEAWWDAMSAEDLAAWDRYVWEGDIAWDVAAQEMAMEPPTQEVRV